MGSLDVQPWQSSRLFRKLATCADARLSRLRPHLPSIGLLGPALHGRLEATWWRPPRCLYKSWRLLGANAATWGAAWIHHMRLHSSCFDIYIYIYICSFFTWFCWVQRKLYNHLTSILFEKHYGCVFCFTERCFPESNEVPGRRSENMACWREQRLVGGEKAMWCKFEGSVWLVARCEPKRHHAAVGWTQCSFFAMAIMRSIYGTCAIYVYKIFQLDWNTWTPTYICILRSYTVYE